MAGRAMDCLIQVVVCLFGNFWEFPCNLNWHAAADATSSPHLWRTSIVIIASGGGGLRGAPRDRKRQDRLHGSYARWGAPRCQNHLHRSLDRDSCGVRIITPYRVMISYR